MDKNKSIISAFIIAIGISVLGFFIQSGFTKIANRGRVVTVKGLSEMTVKADKVTWPIISREVGNDLPELYNKINKRTQIIREFLKAGGLKDDEININAPELMDHNTETYYSSEKKYRYNITSTITVTSKNVDLVRQLIARQGELLEKGVAIIDGGYEASISYDYTSFNKDKEKMMAEAIANAEKTALQFAENSHSKIDKIENASQGQFTIENKDETTPYIKEIRVVTTITYSLKD